MAQAMRQSSTWRQDDKHRGTSRDTDGHGEFLTEHGLSSQFTVSVVIPALNEAANLPYVLPRIPTWVQEVLLVDGYSTDGTAEVARQLRPDIRIIHQEGRGKGAALRSGFAAATGDIVVMLDADGSMDPTEMHAFVGALLAGADFVKGSRFLQGAGTSDMTQVRKLGNGAFVSLANLLFGTRFTDITYGYNAVWRWHHQALALEIDNWANEIVGNIRAARNGLRIVEVACFEYQRIAGQAKLQTFSAGWQILRAIIRERLSPIHADAQTPSPRLPQLPLPQQLRPEYWKKTEGDSRHERMRENGR